jgi:ATP-dependent DNA ligase
MTERRAALEILIGKSGTDIILLSEEFDVAGETFLKLARERGLEGMISKRDDLPENGAEGHRSRQAPRMGGTGICGL